MSTNIIGYAKFQPNFSSGYGDWFFSPVPSSLAQINALLHDTDKINKVQTLHQSKNVSSVD